MDEEVTKEILEREERMFVSVPSQGEEPCRDDLQAFRLHREAQLSVWSQKVRESYLGDLKEAEGAGKNLMTEKYACMASRNQKGGQTLRASLIERIVARYLGWQREAALRYPHIFSGARGLTDEESQPEQTSFETYLRCELKTYSVKTLTLLAEHVDEKARQKINLSEELYAHLFSRAGYDSLAGAEAAVGGRSGQDAGDRQE
ncbi:MAG: DUF4125 family protein [Spirochaetales bacterium]|nr:DUF4125 family protein [Spirochaetales bacterium]MCF7938655.1 DUF4125 family protein [Spirochaetales bacterium]